MSTQEKQVTPQVIFLIVILILGSCLGNLSQTALNAMFSGIAPEFGLEVGLGQWVTTIYMLVLGITVPAVTFLMRRFGAKQIVVGALTCLLAGAALDLAAWDFASLIVGRVFQAISAGVMMPMMMSMIMVSFPRNQQATVMGLAGIAMGFAPNIGPTIGGWMIGLAGWRSFFVALTIASAVLIAVALIFTKRGLPLDSKARFEVISFVLSALGFGGLLLGFSNASSYELANPLVWAPVIVGALCLALFVRRQRRLKRPLINMGIFNSGRFRVSFWAGNFLFASFMGITLVLPLFIENVWGGSAFDAGLVLLPGTFTALVLNPVAGLLTDRLGARPVIVTGSLLLAVGAASFVFVDATTPFWLLLVFQGIRTAGVSSLISPLSSWGMANLPPNLMTDASSFSTAVRQACASFGSALMVFLITLAQSLSLSVLGGYQLAFAFSAVCALAVVLCAVLWVRERP